MSGKSCSPSASLPQYNILPPAISHFAGIATADDRCFDLQFLSALLRCSTLDASRPFQICEIP